MNKYKKICKEIKEQINPDAEFVENLKSNLNKKIYQEKLKRRNFLSKVAVIFIAVTVLSTGTFAMDIGDLFLRFFSNNDESLKIAVENGYVQNVDSEYIEHEGISIKVNSLMIYDNIINIVFDVKGEVEGELTLQDIKIGIEDNYIDRDFKIAGTSYDYAFKSIDKNSHLLILKISNIEQCLKCNKNLEVSLKKIHIISENDKVRKIDKEWNYIINLNQNNFKNLAYKYIIEQTEYLENYEINKTNTGYNIRLYFNESFKKKNVKIKNKIYIQTEDKEKIKVRDFFGYGENRIVFNIPIEKELESFKIIAETKGADLIFDVKKENS